MTWLALLTLTAAIGGALVAGVFLAFSASVMRALDQLPAAQAITTMQRINRAILNPWFLVPFLGLAVPSLWLGGRALQAWTDPRAPYWLAGALAYLGGTLLTTMVRNVPLNEALARVEPRGLEAERSWRRYSTTWTAWNHLRAAAALIAGASFALAARGYG